MLSSRSYCSIPKEIFRARILATEEQWRGDWGEGYGNENSQGSSIQMNWSPYVVVERKGREVSGDPQIPDLGGRKP